MQVPVLLTRQVFVKGVPATMGVLSGMVTSVTNAALLVQLASLVGRGVSGVEGVPGGSSVAVGDNSTATVAWTGASVTVGSSVTVEVATAASVGVCELQPARMIVTSRVMINIFLVMAASYVDWAGFRLVFN